MFSEHTMVTIPYDDILSSEPFWFTVGESKKQFIHSALIAKQSDVLDRLVNGEWKDSRERHVILDQVDEQTFTRFSEFVYTGDYDHARNKPKVHAVGLESASDTTDELVHERDDRWGIMPRSTTKKKKKGKKVVCPAEPFFHEPKKSKQERLIQRFKDMSLCGDSNLQETYSGEDDNQAQVLLSHAKVYVLADYFHISKLIVLSFNKVHRSLDMYKLVDDQGVVELLRFCYQDTIPDQLKDLVTLYASCHVEDLWHHEELQKLLHLHGDLGKSLIGNMLERLD